MSTNGLSKGEIWNFTWQAASLVGTLALFAALFFLRNEFASKTDVDAAQMEIRAALKEDRNESRAAMTSLNTAVWEIRVNQTSLIEKSKVDESQNNRLDDHEKRIRGVEMK